MESEETLLLLNRATVVMHSVRSLAHELNNVLQMISGSAELLELNPDFPPALRTRLDAIATHTGRGCDLVGSVADLVRPQPARGTAVDVGRVLERVARMRKFEQARSGIDIVLPRQTPNPVMVAADQHDLQLMLLNLMLNAEQAVAASARKTISLSIVEDDEKCSVVIGDSGGGILDGPDYFAPLVTTRPPGAAAGLGLTATRILASRYDGEVILRHGPAGLEAVLTLPLRR